MPGPSPPSGATIQGSSKSGPAGDDAVAPPADSTAEAEGRRTLSTAFVRLGPGGHLTVELRDGSTIVLRDVVMRRGDYCGVHALGGATGKRYCGGYGEVVAARPGGGGANPVAPDPVVLNPAPLGRSPSERE